MGDGHVRSVARTLDDVNERTRPEPPRLSVVIPTFNRAEVIADAVSRLLRQVHPSFEIVVVDDGSTDHTRDSVERFTDERVRYVRQPNGGISQARNTGAEAARGHYVVPLDDDDIPDDDWLARLDEATCDNPAVVSCGLRVARADTGAIVEVRLPNDLGPALGNYRGCFVAGTFAVRADAYEEIGGFLVGLQSSHQTEFSMRLLEACRRNDWRVASVDAALITIVRANPESRRERSPEKLLAGTEEIIARHSDLLKREPSTLAAYHGIAGHAAFQLGEYRRSRAHFAHAISGSAKRSRAIARYVASAIPPLGRRVWSSSRSHP